MVVVEPRLNLPFALETSPEPGIVAEVGSQQLQSDDAVQGELGGLIDGPHSSLAEQPVDAVPGDDRALL